MTSSQAPVFPRFRYVSAAVVAGLLLQTAVPHSQAPDDRVTRLDAADAARLAAEARQGATVDTGPGLELTLWAPSSLISDPVSISIDDNGTAYVTSSSRAGFVLDIRGHADWVPEVHTLRSTDDLQQFFHRIMAPAASADNGWIPDLNGDASHDWRDFSALKERVVRLRDTNGDGFADLSEIVFEGFNEDPIYDVATGILANGDDVFVTVAPGVYRLGGARRGGPLDAPVAVSLGYSVHPAFFGHGMSGAVMGPDGRLYWEVGDIGYNVVDRNGRRWAHHNQGAVFRANPDGSDFEVFATGIRNLQDLAFDDRGNLISVDNDGDHPGETERLVYVTEGSDAGWRSNWQYGKYTDAANNSYNVWMDEQMYTPRFDGQAAHITPIIAPWHAGPSGVVFNPGTALSPAWKNEFLISSFPGGAANARIYALQLAADGAGFRLAREREALRGILTPGMRFGPDGALYLTDWITGWESKKDGRVWKLDAPAEAGSAARVDVARRLALDVSTVSTGDLRAWLHHDDMRVRQKAQFALVARRARAVLEAEAADRTHLHGRLHAIWGLGQLMRQDAAAAAPLRALLRDTDAEVRAQAAKVLGDARDAASADELVRLLGGNSPRVTFFATQALGRMAYAPAVGPIVAMLDANDDRDAYLRHAGALALARIGDTAALASLTAHPQRGVRLAAVVALRRLSAPDVSRFLADADEGVAIEAARAINDDGGIAAAVPALAEVLGTTRSTREPLLRRAINASLRHHTTADLARLTAFARDRQRPDAMRVEAIDTIAVWPAPSRLDRVDGYLLDAPPPAQGADAASAAVLNLITTLSAAETTPAERVALANAAGRLGVQQAAPVLMTQLRGDDDPDVRVASMRALQALRVANIDEVMRVAVADAAPAVRRAALRILPDLPLPEAVKVRQLVDVIATPVVEDQQAAIEVLGGMKSAEATAALGAITDAMTAGGHADVQLDIVDAVRSNGAPALAARIEAYRVARKADTLLAAFAEGLTRGGNPTRGAALFANDAAAGCTRCHLIGTTGSDVGPRLTTIGATLGKAQILQALLEPSARLAPGFGTVSLTLRGGEQVTGVLRSETATDVVVVPPERQSRIGALPRRTSSVGSTRRLPCRRSARSSSRATSATWSSTWLR